VRIIPRAEWGSTGNRGGYPLRGPLAHVVIHTWAMTPAGHRPMTQAQGAAWMRSVQASHRRRWGPSSDIGYSFCVDPEGRVYEGRGWLRRGAHTVELNSSGHGLALMGHGDVQAATTAQWDALRWLILEGVRLGHIASPWRVTGHRDWPSAQRIGKTCPGGLIYPHIAQLAPDRIGDDDVDLTSVRGLRKGDEGPEVEELQRLLNAQGGTLAVDGDFGPATEDTLRNYQLHMGCAPTLIADPGTMCLLQPRTQGPDTAALRHQVEGLRAHIAAAHRDARSTVMQTTAAAEAVSEILDEL